MLRLDDGQPSAAAEGAIAPAAARGIMSRRLTFAIATAVILALGGALAIIAVRGPAMLIDLAASAGQMFCF